jgi:hypothetical protein
MYQAAKAVLRSYEEIRKTVLFDKIMELIDQTATDPAMIETCGHAVYVGYKGE